jgi:hypothetical protein
MVGFNISAYTIVANSSAIVGVSAIFTTHRFHIVSLVLEHLTSFFVIPSKMFVLIAHCTIYTILTSHSSSPSILAPPFFNGHSFVPLKLAHDIGKG